MDRDLHYNRHSACYIYITDRDTKVSDDNVNNIYKNIKVSDDNVPYNHIYVN